MQFLLKTVGKIALAAATISAAAHAFEYRNNAQNLQKLFETILHAKLSGDDATAARLTQALIPTRERIRIALKKGTPETTLNKLAAMYSRVPPRNDTRKWASLFTRRPQRSVVHVYGATTGEIAANTRGSIVWKEFPGGAVRAAKTLLRPGMTFYEVERTEPGKERGYKQHLFFWDGHSWCMLGPLWRVLDKPA